MIGRHLVKCWSKAQHVVNLYSAETELYAVHAATEMMGIWSIVKDMGLEMRMVLSFDASAAIAMVSREGLDKAEHIDVQFLWMQEKVRGQELKVVKVNTHLYPADLFTKQLVERDMVGHLWRMGVEAAYVTTERGIKQSAQQDGTPPRICVGLGSICRQ